MKTSDRCLWGAFSFVLAICAIGLMSCQTTARVPPSEERPLPTEFHPVTHLAVPQQVSGSYPDLVSEDSFAVWVSSGVVAMKKEQAIKEGSPRADVEREFAAVDTVVGSKYVVVELHLESAFRDMSIAYDMVGLRGVSAYLTTSDGGRIEPVRVILGKLEQKDQGVLKVFRRSNLLIFPKQTPQGGKLVDPEAASAQLVIQGFDADYMFEWMNDVFVADVITPREGWQMVRLSLKDMADALGQFSHRFD